MTRRGTAFVLAAFWCAAPPCESPARCEDAPPVPVAAPSGSHGVQVLVGELRRLWRDGKHDEFRRRAKEAADTDPFAVLSDFLALARNEGEPLTDEARAMIAAHAAPDAGGALAAGLADSARAWLAADPAALDAEARVLAARRAAGRAVFEAGWDAYLPALRAIRGPAVDDPRSIHGPGIRAEIVTFLCSSGRLDEAVAAAERLREEGRARRWPLLEAVALRALVECHSLRERITDALHACRDECALRQHVGPRAVHGRALEVLTLLEISAGGVHEADRAARAAVDAWDALGDPHRALMSRLHVARCAIWAGRLEEGEAAARDVQRKAIELGAEGTELRAAAEIASALSRMGRFAEALAVCEPALLRAQSDAQISSRSLLHSVAAEIFTRLRVDDAAVRHLEAALASAGSSVCRRGAILERRGALELLRGDTAAGRARLLESWRLREPVGDRRGLASVATRLAALGETAHDTAEALMWSERAVEQATAGGLAGVRAAALARRGVARVAAGDVDRGLADLDAAVAASAAGADAAPYAHAWIVADRARGLSHAGREIEALPHLRSAAAALLPAATGLSEVEAADLRSGAAELAALGTSAAHALATTPGRRDEALATAWWFEEAGRARLLADAIAGARSLVAESLPDAVRRDELAALAELARAQRDHAAGNEPPAAARAALDRAESRLRGVDARVARESVRSRLAAPLPLELAGHRASLDADTATLTYSLSGCRAYAIAVSRDDAIFVDLGEAAALRERVTAWIELASTADGPEERLAERLFADLVAPVSRVLDRCSRILVAPDGPLAGLPLDALVRRDAGGAASRAIERWEIVYEPSFTVHSLLRRAAAAGGAVAAHGVLVLGDPLPPGRPRAASVPTSAVAADRAAALDLRRLPRSGDEARAVAGAYPADGRTLLVGADATLGAFLGAAAPATPLRAIHIACHGFADTRLPRLGGLVFSGGEVLDVETLYRTRLRAELAVLSACDTGGGAFAAGEGVIGLVRGFILAGVPRVVVSAWRVPDGPTADLMSDFHRRFAAGGVTAAEALRAAKLRALRSGGQAAHPYRWGAFVLWGLR